MEKIFQALQSQLRAGADSVLVTIIEQTGSTPRGLGTQMLVGSTGLLAGTVGGGAIEARAIDFAKALLNEKKSFVRVYDLDGSKQNDLGMVCGGGVTLLFSFISSNDEAWLSVSDSALKFLEENTAGCLVQELTKGSAALLDKNGKWVAGEKFDLVLPDLNFGGAIFENYFALPLGIKQRVFLCGGGHVAQCLVPVLASVDFSVTVLESRLEFAQKDLFPQAQDVLLVDYTKLENYIEAKPSDFFIIMTHGHMHDYILEEQLLKKNFAYIGVMGSKKKIASVNARLLAAGIQEEALTKVHTPIGLAIGAATPSEIAISVVAECIAVRASLRERSTKNCPSLL